MKPILIVSGLLIFAQSAVAAPCTTVNSITKVKNRKIGVYEYVDFYVKAPFTGSVSVAAATSGTFIQDGSGNPIVVGGNRWTDVKFQSMDWTCSSATSFALPKTVLRDIKLIGQFEGQIEYGIGRHNGHYLGQTIATIGSQKRVTLKYKP